MNALPTELPLPDEALRQRVGRTETEGEYLEIGKQLAQGLLSALPAEWRFEGKRILDFGSGAGRVLRHLLEDARDAEMFVATDIDQPSIQWLKTHLRRPFEATHTAEIPPLPFPDATFDLIYGVSVFTHLPTSWWEWLNELRRVARPKSQVLLSFQEAKPYEAYFGEPFPRAGPGIVVASHDAPWDLGGPQVFHASWWIEQTWGAVFEVERILPEHLAGWQSLAVLKTPADQVAGSGAESAYPQQAGASPRRVRGVDPLTTGVRK